MSMSGKVALVIGGTRGLGFEVAKTLVSKGSFCYVTGRNNADGELACAALGERGRYFNSDITNGASVDRLFDIIRSEKGQLNLVVNNAGITTRHMEVRDVEMEAWTQVLNVNLLGTLRVLKKEINLMSEHPGGAIVNVSSCAGLKGVPMQSAYSVSKAALNMLTQISAIECAQEADGRHQIRINAVCPGPTLGGMNSDERLKANPESTRHKIEATAMKRFAQPSEIASAILWLLGPDASYMTGSIIAVDGGFSAGQF